MYDNFLKFSTGKEIDTQPRSKYRNLWKHAWEKLHTEQGKKLSHYALKVTC